MAQQPTPLIEEARLFAEGKKGKKFSDLLRERGWSTVNKPWEHDAWVHPMMEYPLAYSYEGAIAKQRAKDVLALCSLLSTREEEIAQLKAENTQISKAVVSYATDKVRGFDSFGDNESQAYANDY